MRVLITGSKGFIGTHLTRELLEHGYHVIGHDREDGDLTNPNVFARVARFKRPDHVIHLAAQVGRLFGERDLAYSINQNALMCAIIGKTCGELDIPVLYSSTSEVYGDQGNAVCHENSTCTTPHNLYGLSKRWGEEVLRLYAPNGLQIVRLSMPYGPGAPPGQGRRALDTFLWQAHHRMPITVHRGAERSWCHVSDTVRGIRMVLERGDTDLPYNIGRDDVPVSMEGLAYWACTLTGASPDLINVVEPPAMQTVVKRLSTQRLQGLGWEPEIDLADGLIEVLDWVRRFDRDANYIEELVA